METLYENAAGTVRFTKAPDFNPYKLQNSGCPVFHVMEKHGDEWTHANTVDMSDFEYAKTIY